jgi:hypothetical protein
LEDRRLFEINRNSEVAADRRIAALAPEAQTRLAVVGDDLEVVTGFAPALALPVAGDASRTDGIRAPVFDYNAIGGTSRGNYGENTG